MPNGLDTSTNVFAAKSSADGETSASSPSKNATVQESSKIIGPQPQNAVSDVSSRQSNHDKENIPPLTQGKIDEDGINQTCRHMNITRQIRVSQTEAVASVCVDC